MGWADCGDDSKGRPIGYGFAAKCDATGCGADINRGLDYACGGMHGRRDASGDLDVCEGYFCHDHLTYLDLGERGVSLCPACRAEHAALEAANG